MEKANDNAKKNLFDEDSKHKEIEVNRVPLKKWEVGYVHQYKLVKQVGLGAYGEVYKASKVNEETNEIEYFALKKLIMSQLDDGFPITSLREIQYLRHLDHENIVNLRDVVVSYQGENPDSQSAYFWSGNEKHTSTDKPDVYLVFDYMEYDLNALIDK